VRKGKDNYLFF